MFMFIYIYKQLRRAILLNPSAKTSFYNTPLVGAPELPYSTSGSPWATILN